MDMPFKVQEDNDCNGRRQQCHMYQFCHSRQDKLACSSKAAEYHGRQASVMTNGYDRCVASPRSKMLVRDAITCALLAPETIGSLSLSFSTNCCHKHREGLIHTTSSVSKAVIPVGCSLRTLRDRHGQSQWLPSFETRMDLVSQRRSQELHAFQICLACHHDPKLP